jgi:DNA-directed RNA polymerase specialized sigma24 family protein
MSMDDSAEEPVDADTETKISSENVLAYINGLDNVNKKQIASLYLIEGMSYKEIDQVVPENMAAIRKTVQRVREEIKQHVL